MMGKNKSTPRDLSQDEIRLIQMLKALSNPVRFQIIQILTEKRVCITGEIVDFTSLAQSTTSQHLQLMDPPPVTA